MPGLFYSLVQLSDLHFSFDSASPFDDRPAPRDVTALNLDRRLREHDIASLASAEALSAAALMVEPMLAEPLSASAPRGCLVSGDICTWPYGPTAVNEVYRYFNGRVPYGAYPAIGFSADVNRQFMFLLGNHDTNGVLFDSHYRSSPFHQVHEAAELTRLVVVPTPHRWIVFFFVRTDFVLTLGWLGPELPGLWAPGFLERFRRTVAAMRSNGGELAKLGCVGQRYDQAIKVLVMHHSPLAWTDYPSFDALLDEIRAHKLTGLRKLAKQWAYYEVTRLRHRETVKRFCKETGIHLVLFGHTHEAFRIIEDGTLYVDVGTTAAATMSQLQAAAHDPAAHARYDFSTLDFFDDDTLTVKTHTMTSESNAFEAGPTQRYDVLPSGVRARP